MRVKIGECLAIDDDILPLTRWKGKDFDNVASFDAKKERHFCDTKVRTITYEIFVHTFKMDVKFLKRVDESVKTIMKDGKIDQNDIPELVLLITDLSKTKKMTTEDFEKSAQELFDYIMDHYNQETNREQFQKTFNMSIKLVLAVPNLKKSCQGCLGHSKSPSKNRR